VELCGYIDVPIKPAGVVVVLSLSLLFQYNRQLSYLVCLKKENSFFNGIPGNSWIRRISTKSTQGVAATLTSLDLKLLQHWDQQQT
jgi:hypothetical protein